MPRNKPAAAIETPVASTILHPQGVYGVADVRAMLRLKESSLRREIREGRLAVCKRCGRYYFLGEQLLDWLRGGEMVRRKEEATLTTRSAD
jgi:hypothetical protein